MLVGICSQQLLKRADGNGRVAALEIMVGTHAVRNLIREGKSHLVTNVIMTAKKEGMQLLDQHLRDLVVQNVLRRRKRRATPMIRWRCWQAHPSRPNW